MRRWHYWLPAIAAAMLLAGCGAAQYQETTVITTETNMREAEPEKEKSKTAESEAMQTNLVGATMAEADGKNILIAYFTWADNTHVADPSSVNVDASTSASVLAPGNAALLASWIQEEVGGDLFSIQVEEPYSSDYDECLDRAADEKAANARPTLTTHVENMEDYDVVFLGFPNWWYTLPMPVLSFVEAYDFSGKTVIPFCTHGTGGLAATIRDLRKALPDSTQVLEPIGVYRPEVKQAQPDVQAWVEKLEY